MIMFNNSKSSVFIALEDKKNNKNFEIIISNNKANIQIYQNKNLAIINTSKLNILRKKVIKFNMEKQSNLSKSIFEKIIYEKKCGLATIEESYIYHNIMIKVFNKHLSNILKKKIINCPIT